MLGINAIKITQENLLQISDIEEFKGLWRGLEQHTTGLNLLGDVADYGAKFARVLDPLRGHPITPEMIQKIHVGDKAFRTSQSTLEIGPNKTLETAIPEDIQLLLVKLCEWINDALRTKSLHPLLSAAVFTSVFLQISPFEDGNLKTVRFLIVLILLKAGYTYAPYVSLQPLMDAKNDEFFNALAHNQESLETGRPDWDRWLAFFMGILQEQKDILDKRLNSKKADLSNVPALSVKIMNLFKSHERLQMNQIIKLTKGRRATIKLRLLELVEGGYLRRHGQGRGTWYALI